MKTCAGDNMNAIWTLKFVFNRKETIVGKKENAGKHLFLIFPHCFQKTSISGLLKLGIVW